MDETSGSTHDLLLALAGQVDDDLLAWARELVAVGENTRAIALVTAGIAADGAALSAPLRAALVTAARAARTDLDVDAALPEATDTPLEHRFAAAPSAGDDRVAAAVGALPARLLDGAEVRLAWRLTPAGSAPGPLPHPVVLVEVEPGGGPPDVLAYQLSVGLNRVGVVASVEVLTSGSPVSGYHAAARREALRADGSAAAAPAVTPSAVPAVEPSAESAVAESVAPAPSESMPPERVQPEPEYARLWAAEGPDGRSPQLSEPDATATDPTGDVVGEITTAPRPVPLRAARDAEPTEPEPRPAPRPFERRRITVTPLTRTSLPSPVPLVRRDGNRLRPLVPAIDGTMREGAATDSTEASDPQQASHPADGDPHSSLEQGQIPALVDTPTFRSMPDPLSGPLQAPLLAPLLDPMSYDEQSAPDDEDEDPFGLHGISPLAPDRPAEASAPAPVEDRWASEWASGDWAVSSLDMHRDPGPKQGPVDRHPAPEQDEVPRHRVSSRPPAAKRPEPAAEGLIAEGLAAEGLGLRPGSVARLSDADRELLAHLQSELAAWPRPRTSRGAGVAAPNGTEPTGSGNGSGRVDPPDLAG